jgi:hypothetical protein
MDDELKGYLEAMEERLTERMRDMQTELLRGFEAFSASARWRRTSPIWTLRDPGASRFWKEDWRKLS